MIAENRIITHMATISTSIKKSIAVLFLTLPIFGYAQTTYRDNFTTAVWTENAGTGTFSDAWSVGGIAVRSGGEVSLRGNTTVIARSADLSTFTEAELSFDFRTSGNLENSDQLSVQVSNNGGSSWTTLQTFSNDDLSGQSFSYSITGFISTNTRIRFLIADTNTNGEFFYLDNVQISADQITCFSDTFNATALNASNWSVNSVRGSFGNPRIQNNRLRITDASSEVSTTASLSRFFPGADNRVVIEFDYFGYGGSGADGIVVTLSDATVPPVAGGFGGSLGYAQRSGINGFAGGWLGIGIDEFGNYSNPTEGRQGGPGSRPDAVAIRGSGSGQTGYRYIRGTNTLSPGIDVSGNTPGPGHRYRIVIDHRNGVGDPKVSVFRNTGTGFGTLIAEFDLYAANPTQTPIPTNFRVSFSGSTGGSTNIHEIDNLSICANKINQVVEIDHFRFFHDGQGLTCGSEDVRVRACLDSNCTQEVTGPITATFSASGAWVGGDTQTFNSGDILTLRRSTPGNLALGIASSDPPRRPFTTDRCFVGTVQQPDCNLNFADSGFSFNVQDHVSDTLQTVSIEAVRTDNVTQRCVPAFSNVTRSLGFWRTYQNPNTGTLPLVVQGTTVGSGSPGVNIPLAFNASGIASMTVRYADVGSLRLNARYAGSAATGDGGLVMLGQDDFVVRPAQLDLTITGNPGTATGSGTVFRRAGEPFPITVNARNASGNLTPNFGREAVASRVQLNHTLVSPAGGVLGVLSAVPGFGVFGLGSASGNWSWDEVGTIRITPALEGGSYLGSGSVPGISNTVGRFRPDRLDVSLPPPRIEPACPLVNWNYVGKPFKLSPEAAFTIQGRSTSGSVTRNYSGSHWRYTPNLNGRSVVNAALTTAPLNRTSVGSVTLSEQSGPPWDGTGLVTLTGEEWNYDKLVAPQEPFLPSFNWTFSPADFTDSDGACYNPDGIGPCESYSVAVTGPLMRYSRAALLGNFGPEGLDLPLQAGMEHYVNGTFVVSNDDLCGTITRINATDPVAGDGLDVGDICIFDVGSPGNSGLGCSSGDTAAKRFLSTPAIGNPGLFNIWLRAPGTGNLGVMDIQMQVPLWLQHNWTGSGLASPTARVSFGVYQDDRESIFKRELY